MPRLDISMRMSKEERLPLKRIILDALDQNRAIDQEEYKEKLKDYQLTLLNLQRALAETKHSVIIVIEGPDAAGKGGAIRRLVERLDPRHYRVYSIVKPSQEEYQHHYLWRFWNKLPGYGQMVIFDRSWYGRVLVERVEGFATGPEWKRAYREINEFERTLIDDGTVIVKLYLHITKEEQLNRFKSREADPLKHWKIEGSDIVNYARRADYGAAIDDMFAHTSTKAAPWHAIPGDHKWFARVAATETAVEGLGKGLELGPPPVDRSVEKAAHELLGE